MSARSQLGFKPFCITCELFETCKDVPIVEDLDDLDDFDDALDGVSEDDSYSKKVDEFFDSSTKNKSGSKLDHILSKNPQMKMVAEMFKLQFPPAIWNEMNTLPEIPTLVHHHIGVTDIESIVGHAIFMEKLMSKKFGKESVKELLDELGPEVLIGVLADKLVKIYATHSEILIKDVKEHLTTFDLFPKGGKK